MKVGYVRSANSAEEVDKWLAVLESAECNRIFVGSSTADPARDGTLMALLNRLKQGDTLVVRRFACVANSMPELVSFVAALGSRDVAFESIQEEFKASGEALAMLEQLTRFERDLRHSSTEPAIRRPRMGRPRVLSMEDAKRAYHLVFGQGRPVERVARELGVSKATLYRYLEEVKGQGLLYAGQMQG